MNGNLSIKVCGVWSFWQSGLLDWLKEITTLIIRKKKKKNKTKKNKKKQKKKTKEQNKTKQKHKGLNKREKTAKSWMHLYCMI